jgi:hypothetical protein
MTKSNGYCYCDQCSHSVLCYEKVDDNDDDSDDNDSKADDISAEVYKFKEANEVLENQVENCDVEKVKTEPEEVKLLVRLSSNFSTSQPWT